MPCVLLSRRIPSIVITFRLIKRSSLQCKTLNGSAAIGVAIFSRDPFVLPRITTDYSTLGLDFHKAALKLLDITV
jgi:hypothetical protein